MPSKKWSKANVGKRENCKRSGGIKEDFPTKCTGEDVLHLVPEQGLNVLQKNHLEKQGWEHKMDLERLQDELTEPLCRLTLESVGNVVENEDEDVVEAFLGELIATAEQWRQGKTMGTERNSANEEAEMQANFQQSTRLFGEEMSRLKEKVNMPPSLSTDSQSPFSQDPDVIIRH